MQLVYTSPGANHFVQLEQIHRDLPSLHDVFACWHRFGSSMVSDELEQRQKLLGTSTLSSASLRLLYDIASQFVDDLHLRVCRHEASQSAVETQALLPQQVLVQKTVSMEMAGNLLLWSGVGQQAIELRQRRAVAEVLGLPLRAAKRCSINPLTCSPEEEFAMTRGMVSPFLPPFRPNRLAAAVLLLWPQEWEYQGKEVGISLSLFESLILPLSCLRTILRLYAKQAYTANVRWIELSSMQEETADMRRTWQR